MRKWKLAARWPEKPPESGSVSIDLTIDDETPLVLRFSEAENLRNALVGIEDDRHPRFSCAVVNGRFVIIDKGLALVTLSDEDAVLMHRELKQLLSRTAL